MVWVPERAVMSLGDSLCLPNLEMSVDPNVDGLCLQQGHDMAHRILGHLHTSFSCCAMTATANAHASSSGLDPIIIRGQTVARTRILC
jgi:hypothetical protein